MNMVILIIYYSISYVGRIISSSMWSLVIILYLFASYGLQTMDIFIMIRKNKETYVG